MISGKKVLAVIPARGGSKGFKLKNLRKICGVPIVRLAAEVATKVKYIDRIVVSTDHEEIGTEAVKAGAEFPFLRPKNLSGDRVSDLSVLTHALESMEERDGTCYDVIVMLQPTSPLREPRHVEAAIEKLVKEDLDAVWTVSETDSKAHPLKQLTIENGQLNYFSEEGKDIVARQQLTPVFHRNGIAYAISRACLLTKKSIKGDKTGALIIEGEHVSIDTEWDFQLAEFILTHRR